MLIKRWAVDLLRRWYAAFTIYCFKNKLYKKNPLLKVINVEDSISLGCAKFQEQGLTTLAKNELPDLYIDDTYQRAHFENYSPEGRERQHRYGVLEISNSFFSFPYPIHRVKKYVISGGMGESLKYLCAPWFLLSYFGTFIPPRKKLDTAILLALPYYDNFYHWMIETLPRLQMLSKRNEFDGVPIVLPRMRTPKFILETLDLCGWGGRVQYLENGSYFVDKLYIPTLLSPRNEPSNEVAEWLNENILGDSSSLNSELSSNEYKCIYISRDDADTRGVSNNEDVDLLFKRLGFKKIKMTDYSVKEQAYIFSRAEMIIGLHGAALTNIVYAKSGCTFIEIFMEGWFTRAFFNLARLRDVKYGYFVCPKENGRIYIDTEKLEDLITENNALKGCSQTTQSQSNIDSK